MCLGKATRKRKKLIHSRDRHDAWHIYVPYCWLPFIKKFVHEHFFIKKNSKIVLSNLQKDDLFPFLSLKTKIWHIPESSKPTDGSNRRQKHMFDRNSSILKLSCRFFTSGLCTSPIPRESLSNVLSRRIQPKKPWLAKGGMVRACTRPCMWFL